MYPGVSLDFERYFLAQLSVSLMARSLATGHRDSQDPPPDAVAAVAHLTEVCRSGGRSSSLDSLVAKSWFFWFCSWKGPPGAAGGGAAREAPGALGRPKAQAGGGEGS